MKRTTHIDITYLFNMSEKHSYTFVKKAEPAGRQWLTPVILATQEDHGSKPVQTKIW
jgi:hypothetical protein